ncbi:hypothetical protein HUS23_06840 [Ectothiorhodospiraceae bacterium 2226]|nr:hypothetical protein HUS23_06840 [Ectothiorhodospiraceae bacterium 2226]
MARARNPQPALKAQDLYLVLALAARGPTPSSYPELAAFTGLSMSEVHGALKRAHQAQLLYFDDRRPTLIAPALREFLLHGARYAFPAARGSMVAGMPTAHAAPPLVEHIVSGGEPPPVWPYADGTVRGIALYPLYPSVPAAAQRNQALYEYLALFDALRSGNARERALARDLLDARL